MAIFEAQIFKNMIMVNEVTRVVLIQSDWGSYKNHQGTETCEGTHLQTRERPLGGASMVTSPSLTSNHHL